MDLLDWVVRGLVGVLLLAFINEKTRRHKMSDQFMTAEEVTARCKVSGFREAVDNAGV